MTNGNQLPQMRRDKRPRRRQVMSGRTGKSVSPHTPLVWLGKNAMAVTPAQRRILERAVAHGGGCHVSGSEVRTARTSFLFGELRDDGKMGRCNEDGERWYFKLTAEISLTQPD
jgi:hypothetical protein